MILSTCGHEHSLDAKNYEYYCADVATRGKYLSAQCARPWSSHPTTPAPERPILPSCYQDPDYHACMAFFKEITCYTSKGRWARLWRSRMPRGKLGTSLSLSSSHPMAAHPPDQPQTHQKSTVQFLSRSENSSFVSASSPSRMILITFPISLARTLRSLHVPSQ